jgi:AbrB family looped-hinge helix DNA binding protein
MNNDKFMTTVKIGPKGQIIIPKEIRDMFGLGAGDHLIIMADSRRGIALQKANLLQQFMDKVFNGQKEMLSPESTPQEDEMFAKLLKNEIEKGENDDDSEG